LSKQGRSLQAPPLRELWLEDPVSLLRALKLPWRTGVHLKERQAEPRVEICRLGILKQDLKEALSKWLTHRRK
jgi:hypothetical protein